MKTTFSFEEPDVELLNQLATKKQITKAEVIRRALMLYDWVEEHRGGDRSIAISASGKSYQLLVP